MFEDESIGGYPGIDRRQYFFGKVAMIVVAIVAVMLFGPGHPLVGILGLLLLVGSIVLDVQRLRNIGLSQWFAFIRFLPFGNLILDLGLASAQTGWAQTRELDDRGKRIMVINLIFLAILIFLNWNSGVLVPTYI
jgi:uncharacterized membrane protein YhaH (DUF805 family)